MGGGGRSISVLEMVSTIDRWIIRSRRGCFRGCGGARCCGRCSTKRGRKCFIGSP